MNLRDVVEGLRSHAEGARRQERICLARLTWRERVVNWLLRRPWCKRLRLATGAYFEQQALIVANNEILRQVRLDALFEAADTAKRPMQSFLAPLEPQATRSQPVTSVTRRSRRR